jgi:preprotein translocase subunit SecD
MKKKLTGRTVVIVATLLLCVFGIFGFPKSTKQISENFQKNIHLGLDLKGGTRLVLQVQVQDAVKSEADTTVERLKAELQKANINYAGMDRNDPQTVDTADSIEVRVTGVGATQAGAFRTLVNERFPDWTQTPVNSTDYKLNMKPSALLQLKSDTVKRARDTIEERINSLGVAETSVQQLGNASQQFQLQVELPGVDDPAKVKEIMGTAAVLEIVEVKEGPFPSQEAAMAQKGGVLPLNTRLVKSVPRGRGDEWYLVSRGAVIGGRDMRNARAGRGDMGKWETSFSLSPDAGKRFARFTESHVGDRLAVILDNQAVSVATIESRIEDSGRITNLGSEEEAVDLSRYLRSGSLPAGVVYMEERSVGPSLGADSIHAGIVSGLAGLAAVIIAMLIYYKRAGLNAVLALLLNTIVLLAALSYFKATLTLPGIAGVILTIGMAVDSNVLIFERIREELRAGKAIVSAVDAGFSKAWMTIVDTHVTTVVSCAFLFIFGSGPVKGFAVTLVIGLIANVFTAVFVSKVIFDYELSGKRQLTELSI